MLLANKLIQNLPHHCNAKENYQSLIRKKNAKSVKQLKIITYQPNTFENPNIVDIKSVIKEQQTFLNKKNTKITKRTCFLKALQNLIMLKF